MSKDSRSGGVYSGNHTTLVPAAAVVCDIAAGCPSVRNITPGLIRVVRRSAKGRRRVKIGDKNGAIFLSVRDNVTHQEIYVYADDWQQVKLAIARGARDAGLHICFGEKQKT